MNRLSARVAARGFRRQVTALSRAGAAADAAERLARRAWASILTTLRSVRGPVDAYPAARRIRQLVSLLGSAVRDDLGTRLTRLAAWGHADAAEGLADHLPRRMLAVAVTEQNRLIGSLLEDDGTPPRPGLVTLTPDAATAYGLPADFDALAADAQRDLFRALLFPPPDADAVRRLVYAGDWWTRLANQTSLAAPDEITPIVWRNIAGGGSIRDLARELLPVVDNVRSTARRVARDESMRVHHATQQAAWNEIDELIVGYQINAVLDSRTRPEHRARNGTIYYKRPGPGQKGFDDMPDPPRESPKDGGKWAYNCRCFKTPVMVDPDTIAAEDAVPAGTLDPDLTADWFDAAPERDRRVAVGAERYRSVKSALGRTPGWRDFIGPGGELLDVEDILGRVGAVQ